MSRNQHMYMIICKKNGFFCYYAQGIQVTNIPFETSAVIALQKITWRGQQAFRKNMLPSFEQFQRAYRLWLKAYTNPRVLRQREIGFVAGAGAPHLFATYYRQTYKKPLFSYETTLGL